VRWQIRGEAGGKITEGDLKLGKEQLEQEVEGPEVGAVPGRSEEKG